MPKHLQNFPNSSQPSNNGRNRPELRCGPYSTKNKQYVL